MGMRMKKLGNTGLVVSEICLGAMTFSDGEGMWRPVGKMDQRTASDLVRIAVEHGVNFFDTANAYSSGRSEVMLGQALRNLGASREQTVIATKVLGQMGASPNEGGLSRAHILNAVDASLKRLEVDYIDLYQTHGRDPLTPLEETLDALNDCVRAGKVRYIGLCNLPAWEITKALWISDKRDLDRFVSAQVYYSLVGRDLEREIVPLALDQGLAILPWSPLAGGALTGKYASDGSGPQGARRTLFDFPPVDGARLSRLLETMRPIAEAHRVSLARIALAWLLHQRPVTSVIIGAKTEAQLLDNLKAADLRLGADELAALDEASRLPSEYPGWMLEFQPSERRKLIE
jgi:aryl-alcohol dehydrogenase-like predicted oxidoreductase